MYRGRVRRCCAALLSIALVASLSGFVDTPVPKKFIFGVTMDSAKFLPLADELGGYGRHPMIVRVPIAFSDLDSVVQQRLDLLETARRRGWEAVANLRYQPPAKTIPSQYLSDFGAWVAKVSARIAQIGDVSIEIANRPNSTVPDPRADSSEPLAVQALVTGVVAAAKAAPRLPVGFSWFATGVVAQDAAFWEQIASIGGRSLPGRVSFVAVQLFPGSLTPGNPWVADGPRGQVHSILEDTRNTWLPMTDLGSIDIRVGEFGAPIMTRQPPFVTSMPDVEAALATEASQSRALQAIAEGVVDVAASAHVTSATWTALTDGSDCLAWRCWGLRGPNGEARSAFAEMVYQIGRTSR